jgi:uncharacterized delta-60 repeat protein
MFTSQRVRCLIIFGICSSLVMLVLFSSKGTANLLQASLDEIEIFLPFVVDEEGFDLDATFDGDGRVTTQILRTSDHGLDTLVQPDGKILVAGSYYPGFLLIRYNPDGSLDSSFGGSGRVGTEFSYRGDVGYAIALQKDGKIIVAGHADFGDLFESQFEFALARYNPDGSLDTSFDGDGRLTTDFFGRDDEAYAVAVQPDGKIVVGGSASNDLGFDFALARFNPDGSLDASFGDHGKLTTDFAGGSDIGYDLLLQQDGKIVVAGVASDDFALARYHPDGSLDVSFGSQGLVTTNLGGVEEGYSAALEPDGKLILVGYSHVDDTGSNYFAVARYHSDGDLDTGFSEDGWLTTYFGGSDVSDVSQLAREVLLQPGGKILVVGDISGLEGETVDGIALACYNADGSLDQSFSGDGRLTSFFEGQNILVHAATLQADGKILAAGAAQSNIGDEYDTALVRFQTDGSLDTSFDGDGLVTSNSGGNDYAYSAVLQPDGKLILAGQVYLHAAYYPLPEHYNPALARYNPDGSLDPTFSEVGWLTIDFSLRSPASVYALALQSDGKILAAGEMDNMYDSDFFVARFTPQGNLDTSFSEDGWLKSNLPGDCCVAGDDVARALVVGQDGKIVVAGTSYYGDQFNIALVRYNPDGSLDTGFDGDGMLTTDFSGFDDYGRAVVLQPDGKIVVAGYSNNGTQENFALVRYNPDGSLDTSFDGDGKLTTDFFGKNDCGMALVLQANGKLVFAGYARNESQTDFALARYNPNGSLDTSFAGDGKLTTDFYGGEDNAYAILLQADGKIIVAGSAMNGTNRDFALVRYNSDGSLDGTFSPGGKLSTDFYGYNDRGRAVLQQSDGRIVVAGFAYSGTDYDFAMARYR